MTAYFQEKHFQTNAYKGHWSMSIGEHAAKIYKDILLNNSCQARLPLLQGR